MTTKKRHDLYRRIISFIYPNVCAGCGKMIDYNGTFCAKCMKRIEPYDENFDVEYADITAAYCKYKDIARSSVLAFKSSSGGNAYYAFASCIYEKLEQMKLNDGIDIITCIPMYPDDLEERGYNQSALIAKELHFMLDVPFLEVMIKRKRTRSQKTLNGEERRKNVDGAFAVIDGSYVAGKSVLLVDDVCTTGSTLSEAARIMKDAGAERVITAVFAKTARNDENEENEESGEEI